MRFSALALQAFFLGCLTHAATAQKAPADTLAFIKMLIQQPDKRPATNQTLTLKSKKGHVYTLKTNAQGIANATVPINNTFEVFCDTNKIQPIAIGATPGSIYDYSSFTYRHCIFTVTCQNRQGKILPNEELTFENTKTGKKHTIVSDKTGKASITLPQADYKLHLKYVPDYGNYKAKPEYEWQTFNVKATWEGTAELERKKADADAEAAEQKAYEEEQARQAKERYQKYQAEVVPKDLRIDFEKDTEAFVEETIWKKADAYKKRLAENPNYLKENRKDIILTLSNVIQSFPNATILLDLDSYAFEQMLIWQAMNGKNPKLSLLNNITDENPNTKKDAKTSIQTLIRAKKKRESVRYSSEEQAKKGKTLANLTAQDCGTVVVWITDEADFNPSTEIYAALAKLGVRFHILANGLEDSGEVKSCQRMSVHLIQLAYATKSTLFFCAGKSIDFSKAKPTDSFTIQGYWTARLNKNGLIDYDQIPARK